MTAAEAIAALEALGWIRLATGDWSWVLASPDGAQAARVSPWDAAYRMHAEFCRDAPSPYLQRIDAILPLGDLGHVVVMERLYPAPEDRAAALCAALALSGDSDSPPPEGVDDSAFKADPEIRRLREGVLALAERGARLPFWGGFDVRPGNVMADATVQLKLIDPIFVAGRKIVDAIVARDRDALARLPAGALAAFFTIPVFEDGGGELAVAVAEMGLAGI
ncbi:MAG TPA: hypothetical protein VGI95_06470 [Caulobacteraceae bacterium]|jgi:hypothetical protein